MPTCTEAIYFVGCESLGLGIRLISALQFQVRPKSAFMHLVAFD